MAGTYGVDNQAHSVLAFAMFESINDILESNATRTSERETTFVDREGNMYLPLNEKADPADGRLPVMCKHSDKTLRGRFMGFADFRSQYLGDDITSIRYNKNINVAILLQQLAADRNTYGVLLKAGEFIINPLHPMIAFMIAAKLIEIPEEGELHIFPWNTSALRDKVPAADFDNEATRFYYEEFNKVYAMAGNIIAGEQIVGHNPVIDEHYLEMLTTRPVWTETGKVNVRVNRQIIKSGDHPVGLLVPFQIAADGIFTPYYGMGAVDDPTSSVRGFNLTPMKSGNFNTNRDEALTRVHSGNVCTGSNSSSTKRGWLTLSRVNLGSMFYGDIINVDETFEYLHSAKKASADIWSAIVATNAPATETTTEGAA